MVLHYSFVKHVHASGRFNFFLGIKANEFPTATFHSVKLRWIDAVTEMQSRSIKYDGNDQYAEVFHSRNVQYLTLLLQFPTPKTPICPMTLSRCNISIERGAVLTQSVLVWTQRVRHPPFWLIISAFDHNCYPPVTIAPPNHAIQNHFHHFPLKPNSSHIHTVHDYFIPLRATPHIVQVNHYLVSNPTHLRTVFFSWD